MLRFVVVLALGLSLDVLLAMSRGTFEMKIGDCLVSYVLTATGLVFIILSLASEALSF